MRFPLLTLILLLVGSGCATHHPITTAKDLSQKRAEVETLVAEINVLSRQLVRVAASKSSSDFYTPEMQARDLDYCITALHQARAALEDEIKRISILPSGPY